MFYLQVNLQSMISILVSKIGFILLLSLFKTTLSHVFPIFIANTTFVTPVHITLSTCDDIIQEKIVTN